MPRFCWVLMNGAAISYCTKTAYCRFVSHLYPDAKLEVCCDPLGSSGRRYGCYGDRPLTVNNASKPSPSQPFWRAEKIVKSLVQGFTPLALQIAS